nr:MAG TPA: RuvC [Caudoviricetes sp.]
MFQLPNIPYFRIIGIDPGTVNLGICILDIDPYTYQFQDIKAYTVIARRLPYFDIQTALTHGETTARIHAYQHYLYQLFQDQHPSIVACEEPFYHRLHPGSYKPLVALLTHIQQALYQYNPYLPITLMSPLSVKKAVNAQGSKDKDAVRQGLLHYQPFSLSESFLNVLDEHAVDACAVCAYVYNHILKN